MRHASATVMPGQHEPGVPKLVHHLDLILSHGAEGIAGVVCTASGFAGITIST